jgi:hypothetical protein
VEEERSCENSDTCTCRLLHLLLPFSTDSAMHGLRSLCSSENQQIKSRIHYEQGNFSNALKKYFLFFVDGFIYFWEQFQ